MFELSMYYYVAGVGVILLLAWLVSFQVRRRQRAREADRSIYIAALQSLLEGDQIGAFYKLKEVVQFDTENIDAYLRMGKILADRGKVKQAIQIHTDLLLRSNLTASQKKAINRYLIDDYLADNQIGKAIELLKNEFQRDPDDVRTATRLLDAYAKENRWDEAEGVAERLFKIDRDRFKSRLADTKIRLGEVMGERGRGRRARTLYKTAFHVDDSRADVWVRVGDSYVTEERMEDAIKAWIQFTELRPEESHKVFDRLRRSLFDLGQFNTISRVFESMLEKDPNNISAAMALAELFEKKGSFRQAQEYYRQVGEIDPRYAPAKVGLARIYREQGKIDEAFELLERLFFQQEAVKQPK